jgi:hypothetical protein
MSKLSLSIHLGVLLGLALVGSAARADLQAPKLGTLMTWTCSGPFTQEYRVKVMKIDGDVVTYQGNRDDESYWVEKYAWLTGTTLWSKKSGDRFQWFDNEDFESYRKLEPGTRFKGAVPAREVDDKWVWDYVVTVDEPQTIEHALVGKVAIVPVTEKRRIYHGTYWSSMVSYIMPKQGLTLRWIYEDPRGAEDCDLTGLQANGQIIQKKTD